MAPFTYGIWIAVSALAGMLLLIVECRKGALKKGTASWLALFSLPLALFGARLCFCLSRFSWFMEKGLGWLFSIQDGGLMMYGALAGLLLSALLTSRVTSQPFGKILDAAAAPGMLTLALGRIGDLAAGLGYGWPIGDWFSVDAMDPDEFSGMSLFHLEDASFFERLPFAVEDNYYGDMRWAVCILVGVIGLVLCAVLLGMRGRKAGDRGIMGIAMTAVLTVVCESLRQDDVTRWGVAGVVKAGEVISAVVLLLCFLICVLRMEKPRKPSHIWPYGALFVSSMGLVMAMEFALEKKIPFLTWMPMDVCYLLVMAASADMVLMIGEVWKRSATDKK